MSSDKTIVFGTGPLGRWVTHFLLEEGKQVVAVNRSGRVEPALPAGVEIVAGDASDAAFTGEVCSGARTVFHCAMPPYTRWPEQFPALTRGILEGAKRAGSRLVFGDNLYMYGDVHSRPMTEDLPTTATTRKGRVRARMAAELLAAHKRGDVPVAIGRASDFYGPFVRNAGLGEPFFRAALAGKPVTIIGNPDMPHSFTYIKDFARALVILSESENAFGEAWHVPNPPPLSPSEIVSLLEDELGHTIPVRAAGRLIISVLGFFNPVIRETREMMHQWEQPYIVDHSKFDRVFSQKATPHRQALRETLDWYRERA